MNTVTKEEPCKVYCYCRLTDVGKMICCDGCKNWFHEEWIRSAGPELTSEEWHCKFCIHRVKSSSFIIELFITYSSWYSYVPYYQLYSVLYLLFNNHDIVFSIEFGVHCEIRS